MAFDARRGNSHVGIDRFEQLFLTAPDGAGIRSIGIGLKFLRPRRSNSVVGALALLIGH